GGGRRRPAGRGPQLPAVRRGRRLRAARIQAVERFSVPGRIAGAVPAGWARPGPVTSRPAVIELAVARPAVAGPDTVQPAVAGPDTVQPAVVGVAVAPEVLEIVG